MGIDKETLQALAADLRIDDAEIACRKAFVELADEDVSLLVELHRLLEDSNQCAFFVEAFYRHLLAFPETRALVQNDQILARLKHTQSEYFHTLTEGQYGPEYVYDRLRIGAVHERVGLAPRWYLGAYNKYVSLLLPKIWELAGGDQDKALSTARALLKIVSFDMALAIDTYIHAKQRSIRRQSDQLAALNQVAVAVNSSLSLKEVLDQIMRQGIALTDSRAACIAFYEQSVGRFQEWVTQGLSQAFVKAMVFRPGGLADRTFTTGSYIISNDRPETRHKLSNLARQEGISSFLCLPLTSHASRVGVLYVYRGDRDTFLAEEISLLNTFAQLAAGAIQNARLHARTVDLAATDALTGLPNRRACDNRLADEIRRENRYASTFSVMLLDIDHFKTINDTYGHAGGDAILTQLAGLLRRQVRDVDFVGRYGGEEFMFVLAETDGTGAKLAGERIRRAVADTSFTIGSGADEWQPHITVSIGIGCFPRCAETAAELTERADQALYSAKQAGRNCVVLYREMLKAELEKHPDRITDLLRQSLGNVGAIVTAIDMKAWFLRNHSFCTQEHALRLGRALALDPHDLDTLTLASLLHDVGVVRVPESVLNKPDALTDEERALIEQHPQTAVDLLSPVVALTPVLPVVRHHHERYDGSGYPDRLRGERIPLLARVLAVVDAYCAMVAPRPHRRALTVAEARAVIEAGIGRQFDPAIAQAFLGLDLQAVSAG